MYDLLTFPKNNKNKTNISIKRWQQTFKNESNASQIQIPFQIWIRQTKSKVLYRSYSAALA